jgi:nitrogen regulatory protein P-II 1
MNYCGVLRMKVLTIFVHTNVQQDLTDLLRSMDQIPGFTFTHVEGHGNEVESDSFISARDEVVGYIPRIRTDILLKDEELDAVLTQIFDKENNITGQGFYWVTPVEKAEHIL